MSNATETLNEARSLAHKLFSQAQTLPQVIRALNSEFEDYLFAEARNGSIMMSDTRNDYVKPVRVV